MKKNFKFYFLLWAIFLVMFGAVAFLVRPVIPGYVIHYDARFWITFTLIFVAFVGNLVCAYLAFGAENLKKLFYNLSLLTVSRSALIAMTVVGSLLMLIPNCPAWIAAAVCLFILAVNAVAIMNARWAADTVDQIDEKVKTQTTFVRKLTVEAESVLARAKSEPVKAECKKVYEAIRYSDPMSNDELSVVEAKITVKTEELSAAVDADDEAKVKEAAEVITVLVKERNSKCKALK